MANTLWDKNFMSSAEETSYLWANKLLNKTTKEYGLKAKFGSNASGKIELTYTFYMDREFIPSLNKWYETTQPNSLESALTDTGVSINPASVELSVLGTSIRTIITVPVLPYTDVPHTHRSVAKYRTIILKRLSFLNRSMELECSISSTKAETLRDIKQNSKSRRSYRTSSTLLGGIGLGSISSTTLPSSSRQAAGRSSMAGSVLKPAPAILRSKKVSKLKRKSSSSGLSNSTTKPSPKP